MLVSACVHGAVAWWERFLGNIGASSLLFSAALIPSPWLLFKFTVNISLCVGSYLRVNIPGWIQTVNHKKSLISWGGMDIAEDLWYLKYSLSIQPYAVVLFFITGSGTSTTSHINCKTYSSYQIPHFSKLRICRYSITFNSVKNLLLFCPLHLV